MTALPFDTDAVRVLATILAETGLSEIEIEGKDGRIRVARGGVVAAPAAPVAMAAAAPAVEQDDSQHPGAILSPMVGIVYTAPEPGAANFVALGQTVTAGQTLLLIEAMKTFNQIKAPKAGTVTRLLVTAGAPVEYGQPLIILD
jgi:acetyl-CoA carboxylase biotin carboxyl carrier protein